MQLVHTGAINGLRARWQEAVKNHDHKEYREYVASDVPMLFSLLEQLQSRVEYLECIRRGYRQRYVDLKMVIEALKWKISQLSGDTKE